MNGNGEQQFEADGNGEQQFEVDGNGEQQFLKLCTELSGAGLLTHAGERGRISLLLLGNPCVNILSLTL